MSIYKKIPVIIGEVGAIEKTRRNQSQGYTFRGIDDLYAAMQPLLAKHGVFYAPSVLKKSREERQGKSGGTLIYTILTMEFTFYSDDGSSFKVSTVGEAMDSGDKSANKAMSAALKYALLQLFCIPTEEDNDTENHSPEPLPKVAPRTEQMPQNPGDYIVQVGTHRGKAIKDIPELTGWVGFHSQNKALNGPMREAIEAAQAYLNSKK